VRWKTLVEQNPDIIVLADRDAYMHYLNHADPGMRVEDMFGMRACDFSKPEDRSRVLEAYRHAWDSQEIVETEGPVIWDGKPRWFTTRISPLIQDNETKNLLVVAREITERKQIEESLRESNERFQQFTEAIDQIFWIGELDPFRLVYLSPAFERIFGMQPERGYQDPYSWLERVHPDDKRSC